MGGGVHLFLVQALNGLSPTQRLLSLEDCGWVGPILNLCYLMYFMTLFVSFTIDLVLAFIFFLLLLLRIGTNLVAAMFIL